ncbi:carbon starvation protein [Kineosphaera limosa]|uniref:Carbon starvation protein A n=1 Tax=Kineosphaera limosa NBRC 100340 TaxID=1184609 RepID=K6X9T1_9MICO|nr:carbon starvation protein A [Kineosphaera limosa]NYD99644.1 carbon starvation protein [Kineosphaera limosa]GAB95599.1 carbon starvation protein A [Kineosphaera limosa NBRC 100340]
MNSVVLAVVGVAIMTLGYLFYSRYLAQRVYRLDPDYKTPAHTRTDGVDFVPTNKFVLWGHHFTSVAGAAPIVGPAIAVIWGWLPAFIWVTVGTVFFAGMHDLGALWASARNKGQSMGTLSGRYIGARGSRLFLVVIFFLLLMVNAAFAVVISNLLVSTPTAVIPTWGAILVALVVGQAIYRWKMPLWLVSVVGVVCLYALILIGDSNPIVLPETMFGLSANAVWILVLFIYAGIASMLPVWMLLQPRDYINGLQLFIGLGILYGSVLIAAPALVAPAWNADVPAGTPGIVPLLFVTIACGALSGFHGMVASGTSSKQLDKETDARFVGYFGAVGEGLLALGAIIATTAGFQSLTQWREIYHSFNQGGVTAFVEGGSNIMNAGLGLPPSLSATVLATMAVLFAATTMDTGVRLQRFVVQEAGELLGMKLSHVPATFVVLIFGLGLAFSAGADGSGGMVIWPLFGTTNQLLAALTLSVIAVMLLRRGRTIIPIVIPLVFVGVMSLYALVVQLGTFYNAGDWLLLVLDVIILVAALWVLFEAGVAMAKARREGPSPDDDDDVVAESTSSSQHSQHRE